MEETLGFWQYFKDAIYLVIDALYRVFGDWGIAIVLITIMFRILILPITLRQTKSQLKMQQLQPAINELQTKYAGDKQRRDEEIMRLYTEAKFNPLSGCIPMLLQMPIFMALFQVLRELEDFIFKSGHPDDVLPASFFKIIPDLSLSASSVFSFTAEGLLTSLPYVVMLLLFGASMLVPMLVNTNTERSTKITSIMMSGLFLVLGWSTPAGVLLYWDTSALIGSLQTAIIKRGNQKKEAEKEKEQIEIKPVRVDVERRERKNRPRKTR